MIKFLLLIPLFLFSTFEVVSRPLSGIVDPYFMTFFRFFTGGLFLLFFSKFNFSKKDFLLIFLIGNINVLLSMTLLQLAVFLSNASTTAVLISTNPIFVSLFSLIILNKTFDKRKLLGIIIGLIGISFFIFDNLSGNNFFLGSIFALSASLTFGLYTILIRKFTQKYNPISVTCISTFFPSLVYLFVLYITNNLHIPSSENFISWARMLYIGIGVTGIAYFIYFKVGKIIGQVEASRLFYLKPVVAGILSILLLGETFTLLDIIGTSIILFSLIL